MGVKWYPYLQQEGCIREAGTWLCVLAQRVVCFFGRLSFAMATGAYPLDELGGGFEDASDDGVDFPLPEGELSVSRARDDERCRWGRR